jgi:hypothetical protein
MNFYALILSLIIAIPLTAILDYFLLRKNYRELTGKEPNKWFWLWPCCLEITLYIMGIYTGVYLI